MGPEGAVNIVYRRELATAADGDAVRRRKTGECRERFPTRLWPPGADRWMTRSSRTKRARALSAPRACWRTKWTPCRARSTGMFRRDGRLAKRKTVTRYGFRSAPYVESVSYEQKP
jgi:hypothetical protein